MMFLVIPLSKTETWQEHGKVHISDLIEMISKKYKSRTPDERCPAEIKLKEMKVRGGQ